MHKKIEKKFFVFEIIASELVALNSVYSEENTCHPHSMCCKTVLRFCMSLTQTFCKSIAFTVINKYGKGGVLDISTKFEHIYHVAFRRIL